MPPETNDSNLQQGQVNPGQNFAGQSAENIVNVQNNNGGINIQTATIYTTTTTDKKPMSRMLTRKLIEAIQDYSPKAKIFLGNIKESEKADWENRSDDKYLKPAKDKILSSYASVLSGFILKLFSCDNTGDYFALTIVTAKRTLKLLCFTFLSVLVDYLKNDNNKPPEQLPDIINDFFRSQTELDISDYLALFNALITIFQQKQIEYPFAEIKNMENEFADGSAFTEACKKINDFAVSSTGKLPALEEIENVLTTFLVSLRFLAAYKMISVKDIVYEEIWYKENINEEVRYKSSGQYLHSYTLLGINKKNYNYDIKPLNTEAVLLYKDKYQDGINLFPFIIDYNVLIDEQEVNICFYAGNEENPDEQDDNKINKILRYFDMNKISSGNEDSDVIIQFDEAIENALLAKPNNDIITNFKTIDNSRDFKAMKKNEAFKAFQEAKNTITG